MPNNLSLMITPSVGIGAMAGFTVGAFFPGGIGILPCMLIGAAAGAAVPVILLAVHKPSSLIYKELKQKFNMATNSSKREEQYKKDFLEPQCLMHPRILPTGYHASNGSRVFAGVKLSDVDANASMLSENDKDKEKARACHHRTR